MNETDGALVRRVAGDAIGAATLYAILMLRVDVFLVEQHAIDRELDGRDLQPTTVHLWVTEPLAEPPEQAALSTPDPHGVPIAGRPERLVGAARVLREGDAWELGRVVVCAGSRGTGVGGRLVRAGSALAGRPLHVKAQAHLEAWYASFGYATCGPAFEWAGISHVPMRLDD